MGIIRMGDPYKFPDTDVMIKRGVKYILDMTVLHSHEAKQRERQLESNGKNVYILQRFAPPEETMNHMITRGIPEIGEKEVNLDGRNKQVFDVWVASGRTYRKKTNKSKLKRKTCRCKK